jgi:hypothetical protein
MRLKYLFDRFSGGQFLQNQLDGDTGACDHRLAHHHAGIGNDHLSVIAHTSPPQSSVPRRVGEVIRFGTPGYSLDRPAFDANALDCQQPNRASLRPTRIYGERVTLPSGQAI